MDDRHQIHVNDYAARLIRFKARMLGRHRAFARDDREDIEQDLWLDLLERLPKYDPARASLSTFVARVVERRVVSLIRYRSAEKRSAFREECSLDDRVLDADGRDTARHETTPEVSNDPARLRELERDMAHVMAHLPDDLRAIALALAFGTQNAVGPELGLSRRAMSKAAERLHEIFRDAGLDEYL